MKDNLTTGITSTCRVNVDRNRTIEFMGDEGRVYSTPNLLYDIEMACRDLLLEYSDKGEDSVGTRVELDHIGATLEGMWVDIKVTVAEAKGRAVSFDVVVTDALEKVAFGKHSRFVVDVAQTAERLKAKLSKFNTL
ncbi:thioesterase family protein [Motiliproteus sp. MSK22-1]|uniref:thioesterase family protein n=1 Tax=Motiliproteus sp. MSK22-1 TaxID=1897630 RepID=UPI00097676AB|nr:LysR family transcriptional regulator [Motiliproteus sp. MSK22-1]OMH29185.1 LysR family transcriptional regulator [Motiliproteus sp. MSK22-1]